jgi:hypothetical protein
MKHVEDKSFSKHSASLFHRAFLLRIRSPVDHPEYGRSTALNDLIKRCLSRSQSRERSIQRDTSESRGKSRTSPEGVQVPESVKQAGLYSVFGIFAIAKDSLREPKHGIPVRHH